MASNVIQKNRQRHTHRHICPHRPATNSIRRYHKRNCKINALLYDEQHQKHRRNELTVNGPSCKLRKTKLSTSKKVNFSKQLEKFKLQTNCEDFSEGFYRLFTGSFFMRFFLILTFGQIINGEGNIGCNFMRTLCVPGSEVCFDDNIFGKCIPTTGVDVEDIDRTPLSEDQSDKLATILLELQGAGLGWDHPYVQCRIQGQLFSMQRHTRLPPNLCANLAPIPSENARNGDLAFVRFIPPMEDYVDAQDDTDHNLLYPPMKKQASVDTIFHELHQQELQQQRQRQRQREKERERELQQQYQSAQNQHQANPLEFLPYGGFDDRTFRQAQHPTPNYPANAYLEERSHYPKDRDYSQAELELARKKLFRMMNDYGYDQDLPEMPYHRNFEEDPSSSLPSFYGQDQFGVSNQQPTFFNPYMGQSGPMNGDEPSFYPSDYEMAKSRFNRMLADPEFNEQSKRHRVIFKFHGKPPNKHANEHHDQEPDQDHFHEADHEQDTNEGFGNVYGNGADLGVRESLNDDTDNVMDGFGASRQKLYQVLADYGLDKEAPDNRFMKALERTISNGHADDLENSPPMFDNSGYRGAYGEQASNDYETFRRLENKEPPRSEPMHRSFFRELAVEQGIEQAPPLVQHQDPPDELDQANEDPFDILRNEELNREDLADRYRYGDSLVRNSLKPFEEEALLSSGPFQSNFRAKHPKVEKVFTEGGLVLVPQNGYQNDEVAYNMYDDIGDGDLEKQTAREFLADMLGFTRHERLDVKKPGPMIGPPDNPSAKESKNGTATKTSTDTKEIMPIQGQSNNEANKMKKVIQDDLSDEDANSLNDEESEFIYVYFKNPVKDREDAERIMIVLSEILHMQGFFDNLTILDNGVSFRVNSNNPERKTSADMAKYINDNRGVKKNILRRLGVTVLGAKIGTKSKVFEDDESVSVITKFTPSVIDMAFLVVVVVSCLAIAGISIFLIFYHRRVVREKLNILAKGGSVNGMESCSKDYQDLCRARMAGKGNTTETVSSGRITSLSKENERPPSSRSSTSSWCEEPALTNMDISTGHMVLSYMEDHLRNKGRLQREWEALCRYEAEPSAREAAQQAQCANFNRSGAPLPYDHSRVVLNHLANAEGLDYINASSITDHDPRAPAYVAAQGPLPTTLAHFWQMIWEQGAVVIVSLCRLQENGEIACARYWPEEGAEVYHIYEVNLVSEHIWCDDYLVRSFYLKNLRTSETRTVTQFHFLSWPQNGVPAQAKALLDFRRKVNKSYRGRSCPIVVHGSTGAGRTGAYILLDLVLGRMNKGAREIDIAATLEHLRDQRAGLVATRQQFEFVLMAVAEEVHAILKALPANQSNDKKDIETNKETNGVNGTSNNGLGSNVASNVLKEEEAENTEDEIKPTTSATTTTHTSTGSGNGNGTATATGTGTGTGTVTGNKSTKTLTTLAKDKENDHKNTGNKNMTPAKASTTAAAATASTSAAAAQANAASKKK